MLTRQENSSLDVKWLPEQVVKLNATYRSGLGFIKEDGKVDQVVSEAEVSLFIHSLIRLVGATRILEVGTYNGYTTCYMASAARELKPDAKVITIDPSDPGHLWEGSEIAKNIVWINKTVQDAYDEIKHLTFDLIFIDSLHRYSQLAWELGNLDPLLRSGGYFVMHDTLVHDGLGACVSQLYDNPRFEVITFNTPRKYNEILAVEAITPGLTVARKIASGSPYLFTDPNLMGIEKGFHSGSRPLLRKKLIQKHEGYYDALNSPVEALFAGGKNDEALNAADSLLAEDPQNYVAWNNKAVVLNAMGRAGEAVECFKKALSIRADYDSAAKNLGLLGD